jgi:hypothetical protein
MAAGQHEGQLVTYLDRSDLDRYHNLTSVQSLFIYQAAAEIQIKNYSTPPQLQLLLFMATSRPTADKPHRNRDPA